MSLVPRIIEGVEVSGLLFDAGWTPRPLAASRIEHRSILVPISANAVLTDSAVADITERRLADPSSLVTGQAGPLMSAHVLVKSEVGKRCCEAFTVSYRLWPASSQAARSNALKVDPV